jgi:hypothetical protein
MDEGRVERALALMAIDESVRVEFDPALGSRSIPWMVEVTVAAPFAAFFANVAGEAGKDVYRQLRAALTALVETNDGKRRPGTLRLNDPATRSTLEIPSTIPDDALAALRETDWTQMNEGMLEWDSSRREWGELR